MNSTPALCSIDSQALQSAVTVTEPPIGIMNTDIICTLQPSLKFNVNKAFAVAVLNHKFLDLAVLFALLDTCYFSRGLFFRLPQLLPGANSVLSLRTARIILS